MRNVTDKDDGDAEDARRRNDEVDPELNETAGSTRVRTDTAMPAAALCGILPRHTAAVGCSAVPEGDIDADLTAEDARRTVEVRSAKRQRHLARHPVRRRPPSPRWMFSRKLGGFRSLVFPVAALTK